MEESYIENQRQLVVSCSDVKSKVRMVSAV
jgi:hypothetical protein